MSFSFCTGKTPPLTCYSHMSFSFCTGKTPPLTSYSHSISLPNMPLSDSPHPDQRYLIHHIPINKYASICFTSRCWILLFILDWILLRLSQSHLTPTDLDMRHHFLTEFSRNGAPCWYVPPCYQVLIWPLLECAHLWGMWPTPLFTLSHGIGTCPDTTY